MAQWYAGGCPPGWSQPAPGYDCRPNVSGQVVLQQNLESIAARYADDSGTTGGQSVQQSSTQASAMPQAPSYQAPAYSAPAAQGAGAGSGLDLTMLLIIGTVLFFVMKK